MNEPLIRARLRITPACSFGPESTTLVLHQRNDAFKVLVIERQYDRPEPLRRRIKVDATEARQQLEQLRQVRIPAYPCSPQVCDGEYWKLTIEGECSALSLGWWTAAPLGAERLADFAEWLYRTAFPD